MLQEQGQVPRKSVAAGISSAYWIIFKPNRREEVIWNSNQLYYLYGVLLM